MKKFSLLILLALLVSIGGVYATWVYTQSNDVADITEAKAITMTNAEFIGTYGTYTSDASTILMKIDPKEGTTHVTSLVITGEIVITFTPTTHAPVDVKENAVATTYTFSLSNNNWKYGDQFIMTVDSQPKNIVWEKQDDGTFKYTITAAELASILTLTDITLDTKAEYDAYDAALTNGQIVLTISDGITSSQN